MHWRRIDEPPLEAPFRNVRRPQPRSRTTTGRPGRSEWLDVDWQQHLRSTIVHGSRVNYVEMGDGPPLVFIHGLSRLLAELAREHPALRPPPPRDRGRPARLRRVRASAARTSASRATAASSTPSWARSASSARRWSATRWAASSRPRPRSAIRAGSSKLVLVSAAGRTLHESAIAQTRRALERAAPALPPADAAVIARREHLVRRPRLRAAMLYRVVRYPDAHRARARATRSRAAPASPASSTRSRRSSTTTSATGCRRSRTRR